MFSLDAETLAKRLIAEHVPGFTFQWDRSERRFGSCQWGRNGMQKITLSLDLVQRNTEETVRNTILHEVAHALAGRGHNHDYVWQAMCRRVGIKPERCYDSTTVKTAPKKYTAKCTCGMVYGMNKDTGRRYRCRKCKQPVTFVQEALCF